MKPNSVLRNRPCVYGILNTINQKLYVGRSKCIYMRANQYIYDFQNRSIGHLNDYLFNAMSKMGIENFEIFPLEFCDVSFLPERELWWIIHLDTVNRNRGYNLRLDVEGKMSTSPETSRKISKNLREQWSNGERNGHAEKLSNAWVGRDDWRETAAATLRKSITKWQYNVTNPNGECVANIRYSDLKSMSLEGCLSNFHRSSSNTVSFKNYTITRFPIGENDA